MENQTLMAMYIITKQRVIEAQMAYDNLYGKEISQRAMLQALVKKGYRAFFNEHVDEIEPMEGYSDNWRDRKDGVEL